MDIEDRQHEKARNAANMPWVEKYRPSHLGQLISHQSILETRTNCVK